MRSRCAFAWTQLAQKKCLTSTRELAAIGFKAVHAQGMTGVHRVDDRLLAAMEAYNDVAPAHNPPYVSAMRLLAKELPDIPMVAAFESGFHETIAPARKLYAVPLPWAEKYGVKRYGFHGASHRYIAQRTAQRLGKADVKIISCHLGGSSSICAIKDGKSQASSMGMSPQSGLPQNNRVGDFDAFALPALLRATGLSLAQLLDELANRSGLWASVGSTTCAILRRRRRKMTPTLAWHSTCSWNRCGTTWALLVAARRSRRHRLHGRHRRKLRVHARRRLRRSGLVRHSARPKGQRRRAWRNARPRRDQPRAIMDHADQRRTHRRPPGERFLATRRLGFQPDRESVAGVEVLRNPGSIIDIVAAYRGFAVPQPRPRLRTL